MESMNGFAIAQRIKERTDEEMLVEGRRDVSGIAGGRTTTVIGS
jgi:hypothetical protein